MASGDGDTMPAVEFGGAKPEGEDDGKDLFEDQLEEALCVFKTGGANSDLLEENANQILFYLDLDNEEVVVEKKDSARDADDSAETKMHPVLFNQYPLCNRHSLFLLFAEEGLPQVLSDEVLIEIFQIFKMSDKPQLRLGYNSMGADCIINNLHFHVLGTDDLFQQGIENFPIETADKRLFFKSNLKHKSADEINMYNCGVRFGETVGWPMQTLLLSPDITSEETSLEDA